MADFDGTGEESTEVAPEVDTGSGPESNGEAPSGVNPAWEPLRSKLDPVTFKLIEDDLRNWDKEAETRISSLNKSLSDYKKLGTPDVLAQYATVAQRIEAEPEVIYQALGEFLKQTGRMPTQQELTDKVDEIEDDEEQEEIDPALRELREGQEQIRRFLAQQEQERLAQQADAQLTAEVEAVKEAHPELDEQDMKNIFIQAAFLAQQSRKEVKLEDVAKDYIEHTRNRILGSRRPNDTAPSLVPSSGAGVPMGAANKKVGELSRTETQDLVASLLSKQK